MKYVFSISLVFFSYFNALSQADPAEKYLIDNAQLKHSFIGITVYDPATGSLIYNHNGFRYFTPASTTKLFSLYAGLQYLQDSTTGIQYQIKQDTLFIRGTGDPTFLHQDFSQQPVYDFLKKSTYPIAIVSTENKNEIYAPGWAWEDYNGDYQPERNSFPIYGNVARFSARLRKMQVTPSFLNGNLVADSHIPAYGFKVKRDRLSNQFNYNISGPATSKVQEVPFMTSENLLQRMLQDTLHKKIYISNALLQNDDWKEIRNVPLDSMFEKMMHRSDNFYAEQTDAMVSMKLFKEIDTKRLIKYLLENDLKDLPDKPEWVDGSGLSRYNLFSPADMVMLLTMLYQSFPSERIYRILPTGGEGTLEGLYGNIKGKIYAKTGSLSNNVALCGYLITRKNKTLIFSIMINHTTKPLAVGRHAMENFLKVMYEKY